MKNIPKIMIIVVIVFIGGAITVKNFYDGDKSYVVSDIEDNKDKYIDNTINNNENSKVDNIPIDNLSNLSTDKITIYISGEVKSPGVVELNTEDRLADGVDLCGGLTNDANLNAINLAMRIQDEGHYIIPKIGEELVSTNTSSNKDPKVDDISAKYISQNEEKINNENKININTATISELDSLPGFGEITAQKIIDYRDENNEFNSIEEIKNIKGIGDKKFNDVKDYICVQ